MSSNENTFPLGSFLYLAEKHSKDICWCSRARQQSLQTEGALFSTSQFTDQGESPPEAPLSHILCPAQPCKVQGRAGGLPALWSRMTSPRCVCTAPTTSAGTPNQSHRRCWTRTKPGMFETIEQQMQQKWINLHLNKSKSQREVKDNKLWKQLKGEMVHFHCRSWLWEITQSHLRCKQLQPKSLSYYLSCDSSGPAL